MNKFRGYLYIVSALIIWGSIGLFIRNVDLPAYQILLIGSTASLVVMIVYLTLSGQFKDFVSRKYHYLVFLYPIFQTITGFSGYTALEDEKVLTSVSMLIFQSAPLIIVFLAPILIKEKSTKGEILFAFMGFVGLVLFVLSQGNSGGTIFTYGMIFAVIGLIFNAISSVINRKISQELPTHYIPAIVALGNVILLWPYHFLRGDSFGVIDFPTMLLIIIVGIFSTIVAFLFFSGGLRTVKSQEASIIGLFQPVYIALLGYLFLSEKLTLTMLPGAVIIIVANLLLVREGMRKDK
jgi:drug/metabolite transporter (DMT)-like permease